MIPTHRGRPLARPDEDIFDQGLAFDLQTMLDRRQLLKLIGYSGLSAGLFALAGCGSSSGGSAGDAAGSAPAAGHHGERRLRFRRLRAHPGGDGRAVSRRRLERPGRARPERRRSQRHPHELRRLLGHRRGRPADDQARASGHVGNGCAALAGGAVYVWHCDRDGPVLPLHAHRPELPARGAGGRRRRRRHVHEHLPRLLLGPLAAHPLRGLPESRSGDRHREHDRDVPGRLAGGRMQRGVRDRRVRPEHREPAAGEPRDRQRVRRRRRRAPARYRYRQRR